jgi:hypothetical protein
MARPPVASLQVSEEARGTTSLLSVAGVLDGSTYLTLRDSIIKAALDQPDAVIVDVNALEVPADSAWTVFTSARWHVSTWPDVPIVLICADGRRRTMIRANGVTRYVPVHPTADDALSAVAGDGRPPRQRARIELLAAPTSTHRAREAVTEHLTAWSKPELIAVANVVASVLIENVLQHTDSAPVLRLESDGQKVTVAVSDDSRCPAAIHEDTPGNERVSSLSVLAAMCRAWGSSPTPSGKTVWAVIGSENRL